MPFPEPFQLPARLEAGESVVKRRRTDFDSARSSLVDSETLFARPRRCPKIGGSHRIVRAIDVRGFGKIGGADSSRRVVPR